MAGAGDATNGKGQLPYILALDAGTSSARALLFDASGAAVPQVHAQRTYELTTSEAGEISVDADALVATLADAIDEALTQAGPLAEQIGAVATDTFWHSLIAVDASGQALTPVITWADTRPRDAAQELRRELDPAAVHRRTGAIIHASYWPAKLRWLTRAQPEVFRRAARYISFGEYFHQKVLGRSVCSLCMASGTGLLLTHEQRWDTELLKAVNVREEQLPPLGDLNDSLLGLSASYTTRWPTLRDVPWFPALGDGATANAGSGCAAWGRLALTVGTSSAVRAIVPVDHVTPPDGLWLYLLDAQRGVLGGALSEGGNVLAWLDATLRLPQLNEAEQAAGKLPLDGHGLTVLPFLAGERSLGWHAEARATVAGIHAGTTPAELLRAGIESLAYRIGAVYDRLVQALRLAPEHTTVIGSGGTLLNSPLFQQIIADTLGVLLYPSREHEASARGAALLALEALGVLPDVGTVAPVLADPARPDATRGAIYRRAAARQEELYHRLLS